MRAGFAKKKIRAVSGHSMVHAVPDAGSKRTTNRTFMGKGRGKKGRGRRRY